MLVESTAKHKATLDRFGGNEVHDHPLRDDGLAATVLGDEGEEAVFDHVPLAPLREMIDGTGE